MRGHRFATAIARAFGGIGPRLPGSAPCPAGPPPGRSRSAASGLVLLLTMLAGCGGEEDESLTVAAWGGAYTRACKLAYHTPFTAETGIEIRDALYNGGLAEVRAQVDVGHVHWDVVPMEMADAVRACDEGLLEPIDRAFLTPGADGSPPEEDFLPGTLTECGVGAEFYSTVIAWNRDRIQGASPATVDDFFDLEAFPGRRGMRRKALGNLELALMADGVPPGEIYAVLDTPEGVARAFRKLDTIRDRIVWWEAGAQPPQLLADGEVVMTTAYNGRIFNAQILENQPFEIIWDGQILSFGQTVIVAGTPRLEAARRFVSFIARPESQAELTRHISYSSTRASGLPLVGRHAETGIEMLPHMPTAPQNMGRALHSDWEWWVDHTDEMNERFSAWLAR